MALNAVGFATSALGSVVGQWLSPAPRCECVIRYEGQGVDESILSLLGSQLERCGPERLASTTRSCPPCLAGWSLPAILFAAAVGTAFGVLVGLGLPRWRSFEGKPSVGTPSTRRRLGDAA